MEMIETVSTLLVNKTGITLIILMFMKNNIFPNYPQPLGF